MRYELHPLAVEDVEETALDYEEHGGGLGHGFTAEVGKALERLSRHPELGAVVRGVARRLVVSRPFAFHVVYAIDKKRDQLIVLAVVHPARHPRAWQERI